MGHMTRLYVGVGGVGRLRRRRALSGLPGSHQEKGQFVSGGHCLGMWEKQRGLCEGAG